MKSTALLRPPSAALWRLATITGLLFCGAAEVHGQSATTGNKKTIAGVVKRFTNDIRDGTVNGVVLDTGSMIRWWPFLSKRFTSIVTVGDPIQATGRVVTVDRSTTVLWAGSVTNLKSRKTRLDNDDPLPVPRRRPTALFIRTLPGRSVTLKGTVERLTTAPDGNVNGLELTDGTLVRWPERLGGEFTEMVGTGSRVIVIGLPVANIGGHKVLLAEAVSNERTNATRSLGPVAKTATPATPPAKKPMVPVVIEQPSPTPEKLLFGTVKQFTTAPTGKVQGVILTNGTAVRWPLSLSRQFAEALGVGDRVEVTGRTVDRPGGVIVLEATAIKNLDTKTRVVAVQPPTPPMPPKERTVAPPPDTTIKIEKLQQRIRSLEDKIDRLTKAVETLRPHQPQQPQQ